MRVLGQKNWRVGGAPSLFRVKLFVGNTMHVISLDFMHYRDLSRKIKQFKPNPKTLFSFIIST